MNWRSYQGTRGCLVDYPFGLEARGHGDIERLAQLFQRFAAGTDTTVAGHDDRIARIQQEFGQGADLFVPDTDTVQGGTRDHLIKDRLVNPLLLNIER
jgi:hypothetical protein